MNPNLDQILGHMGFLKTPTEYWKTCMLKEPFNGLMTVTITIPTTVSSLFELMAFLRQATFSRFMHKPYKLKYREAYKFLEDQLLNFPVPPEAIQK